MGRRNGENGGHLTARLTFLRVLKKKSDIESNEELKVPPSGVETPAEAGNLATTEMACLSTW